MRGNMHGGKQLGQNKKQLTVFISVEMHNRLLEKAKKEELTISDITRMALRNYLAPSEAESREV